jgi:hypothetical protein
MSTTAAAPRTDSKPTSARRARAKHRPLPQRALLVELGTAAAMREGLATATKPLTHPADLRHDISRMRARVTDGLTRLERRGERANTELKREAKRARTRVRQEARRRRQTS